VTCCGTGVDSYVRLAGAGAALLAGAVVVGWAGVFRRGIFGRFIVEVVWLGSC